MPHGETQLEAGFQGIFADAGVKLPSEYVHALVLGLVKAVEWSTESATQNVARINRRRLVRHTAVITALVTALITAAIAIPVTYVLASEGRSRNCRLITQVAKAAEGNALAQQQSSKLFLEQSKDRLGLSPTHFAELIARTRAREAHELAVYQDVAHAEC